ncbi:hypothetical protein CAP35_09740 [Chitinophagaceae bacterium IBVUCB1]|nr:hypothetical protein CAP35_09740 [Chitinophagaceae bacterium IBVUCB1]
MSDIQTAYIELGKEKLHYLRTGKGSKLLVAFHGYGNEATMFMPFADYLPDYTIVSIDLPHHGKSHWTDGVHLDNTHLQLLVSQLLQIHGCTQLSLMGYSMGGRVCLKIAELMPDKISDIVLLASDGLTFNTFYYFVTRTTSGRYLFRSFLSAPHRYMPIVNWAKRRKLIDASHHKFAMQYLHEEDERYFLLKVWPCMSLILPDYKKLRGIFNQHSIPVSVYMGKHDRVIPVSLAERFRKILHNAHIELYILDKGHALIDKDTLPVIAKSLNG